ncbi:MAG: DUF58 domain-containing protein [Chloroflexota bacterium]|nr:DUF58 domain-containing protein [Chloroflexota bacterium]
MSDPTVEPLAFDEAFLRRLERLAVTVRRSRSGQNIGVRRSPLRGSSVEFADFRSYSLGDDLRRVDWNAYARLGKLFVRLYHDEQNTTLHILLDTSASMDWGIGDTNKLFWGRRLAAALGYIALAGQDRVVVTTVAASAVRRSTPFHGVRSARRLFTFLSNQTSPAGGTDLDTALSQITSRVKGPVILISDLLCPGWGEGGLTSLRNAGHDVSIIHCLSPAETEPTFRGDLRLIDHETGTGRDVTADDHLLDRYRASLDSWRAELATHCLKNGMAYISARTDETLESLVLGGLRRERVVA